MRDDDLGPWVSAGDLADYAFCPRSHWYARTRPDARVPRESARRVARGEAFHASALSGVRARSTRRGAYAAAVLLGILLAVLGAFALLGR
ncbi:MAG TPA: hypothetical protein VMH90_02620 [Thermoplasmata archaeon]|nr:hypothetical protein [Thermoplasmata archaeon]